MIYFLYEKGQGLTEYALLLTLIALVVIGILTVLGTQISQTFSNIVTSLP